MTTAIRKVHLPNGPWAAEGGWEYNAVLMAIAFVVVGLALSPSPAIAVASVPTLSSRLWRRTCL